MWLVTPSAAQAKVIVRRSDGALIVEVSDDGQGSAGSGSGSGLRGLKDRISALGGNLMVDSPPGRGTVIRAQIPCIQSFHRASRESRQPL